MMSILNLFFSEIDKHQWFVLYLELLFFSTGCLSHAFDYWGLWTCIKTSVIWSHISIQVSLTTTGSLPLMTVWSTKTVFAIGLSCRKLSCQVHVISPTVCHWRCPGFFQTAPIKKIPISFSPDGGLNFSNWLCCGGKRGAVVDRSNNFAPNYNQTALDFVITWGVVIS